MKIQVSLRRAGFGLVLALLLTVSVPGRADRPPVQAGRVLAGAAKVDSTWHVGASAGQYASDGTSVGSHGVDYHGHSTKRESSYGIQGREWARALVVKGADGSRLAVVSNDLYIPQDLVNRRVAQIIADYDAGRKKELKTGIKTENLMISVSHSHSSPYYSTPSWGVWAFQDVFDVRFFEHIASKMAEAVIKASENMVPVRMGAATSTFTGLKKHSYGPAGSYDGLPGGYPRTDVDGDLSVIRFDNITNPAAPSPLATWVVWGMHPENLDGNDLLTGEYVNTMYRILDREIGGVTLFSQSDTGTAEADESQAHAPSERQEFSHREYGQMERASRQLSDAVVGTYADVARVSSGGGPAVSHNVQQFDDDFVVGMKDLRFAPPGARVLPTVSSCRTEKAFDGNPGFPLVGLPDCGFIFGNGGRAPLPFDPGVTYDTLRAAGVPIPDNIGAPSYTGLQETIQVHLQAIRLGGIAITVCPCEQWADQSRNIKARLNQVPGDLWFGWDWTANYTSPEWKPGVIYDGRTDLSGHGPLALNDWCAQNSDTTWTCKNSSNPSAKLAPVSDEAFRRMKAQIYNDARGWDDLANSVHAESEPHDLSKVWGNFTHEELTENGYPMVITVGMSNDYWGYIASFREFQRGDHYRKALTGLGPHSMDFFATRLSRMAAELKGGPKVKLGPKDEAYEWDYEHQGLRASAIGNSVRTYLPAYEAALPIDGGTPSIIDEPDDVQRFSAAKVSWIGGDNYFDTPHAKVERCTKADPAECNDDASAWVPYADGQGEVEVKANFPRPEDMPMVAAGQFQWRWDATFEAFDSDVWMPDASVVRREQTPSGVYRFVIEGCHRGLVPSIASDPACPSYDPSGRVKSYELRSAPFHVGAWEGIQVTGLTNNGSSLSFEVGPKFAWPASASNTELGPIDYPDTYASPFRFIHGRIVEPFPKGTRGEDKDVLRYPGGALEVYCFHCSFRPWADTGAIAQASVTVVRAGGGTITVPATCDVLGQCIAAVSLLAGDQAWVERGAVSDRFGEFNGSRSSLLIA